MDVCNSDATLENSHGAAKSYDESEIIATSRQFGGNNEYVQLLIQFSILNFEHDMGLSNWISPGTKTCPFPGCQMIDPKVGWTMSM